MHAVARHSREVRQGRPDARRPERPCAPPAHRPKAVHAAQGRPSGSPPELRRSRGGQRGGRSRVPDDWMLGPEGPGLERAERLARVMLVYLDTGALIALGDRSDPNHPAAVTYFREAARSGTRFVIGRPVYVEYLDGVT